MATLDRNGRVYSPAHPFATAMLVVGGEPDVPDVVGYWGEHGGVERSRALGAGGDLNIDGSLGSRSARLSAPYADAPGGRGRLYLTAEEAIGHVVTCTRAGVQAGFHCIGDDAVRAAVTGIAEAARQCGLAQVMACRHRLEHVEMLDDDLVPEIARLGVVASVQPAFGSDSPVTPLAGWESVRAAMYHHTPEHRLSARRALSAATRGGWRAARVEDAGVLAPGMLASFAIWAVPGELVVPDAGDQAAAWPAGPRAGGVGLPDLAGAELPRCLRTVVRGRTVWTR